MQAAARGGLERAAEHPTARGALHAAGGGGTPFVGLGLKCDVVDQPVHCLFLAGCGRGLAAEFNLGIKALVSDGGDSRAWGAGNTPVLLGKKA